MDLARCWGVAENGEAVEVAVRPHPVEVLDDRRPPLGLRHQDHTPEQVTARFGLSDTWMIVHDTEPSGDMPPTIAWDLLESELGLFAVKRLLRLVPVHAAAIASGGTVLSDEFTLIDPAKLVSDMVHAPQVSLRGCRSERLSRLR